MLSTAYREFPVTTVLKDKKPSKEKTITVTEAQVQEMIDDAIRQHNRNAGLISKGANSTTYYIMSGYGLEIVFWVTLGLFLIYQYEESKK